MKTELDSICKAFNEADGSAHTKHLAEWLEACWSSYQTKNVNWSAQILNTSKPATINVTHVGNLWSESNMPTYWQLNQSRYALRYTTVHCHNLKDCRRKIIIHDLAISKTASRRMVCCSPERDWNHLHMNSCKAKDSLFTQNQHHVQSAELRHGDALLRAL